MNQAKEKMLRNYQIDIRHKIFDAWNQGNRSVMCQMPTGTGKSVVLSSVIHEFLCSNIQDSNVLSKIIVVAHRREIIEQIKDTLGAYNMQEELDNGLIVVDSIQKLSRSYCECEAPELVVIDEAHHATAKTYKKLWEMFPYAKFLGMTATPCRLKKEGFGELFDKLVCSWEVSKFVYEGWLSLFEYVTVMPNSEIMNIVRSLKKRGVDGDYQMKEMCSVMDNRASIEQLYKSYEKYAKGRKGIIYAINCNHGHHIEEYYRDKGLNIVMIDAKTPTEKRKRLVTDYQSNKIDILVSVDCFGEGFDCPAVSFIQLARPTLSLSKYLQQVGRGLRPQNGKQNTIILDNVGHYYMFGLPNEDRNWHSMFLFGQKPVAMKSFPDNYMSEKVDNGVVINDDVVEGHDYAMIVVMKDDDLVKKMKIKEYEVFKGENGLYGIRYGDKIVCDGHYRKIGVFAGGFAKAIDKIGDEMIVNQRGDCMFSDGKIKELFEDGVVEYIDNQSGEVKYYDLITGLRYLIRPKIVQSDFLSFVQHADGYRIRWNGYYPMRFDKEDLTVRGDVFMHRDKLSGMHTFIHRSNPKMMYRLVGYDDDQSKILIPIGELFPDIFHVCSYKNGMLYTTPRGKDGYGKWYRKDREVNAFLYKKER